MSFVSLGSTMGNTEGLGETKLTVSLGASHWVLINTDFKLNISNSPQSLIHSTVSCLDNQNSATLLHNALKKANGWKWRCCHSPWKIFFLLGGRGGQVVKLVSTERYTQENLIFFHYPIRTTLCNLFFWEKGWHSGESTCLPPMCPGFNSRTQGHM